MNLQWLILKKKVDAIDEEIKNLGIMAFPGRIIPEWMPPEYGKEKLKITVPIDYLNEQSIKELTDKLTRLVAMRTQLRQQQAKLSLALDVTKIHEIVPT